jgi:hypothetical protein
MSNPYDEFLDDDTEKVDNSGGKLRDKLEAAIKLLKEKDKAIGELTKAQAKRGLNDLLTKAEVPAKFHKLAEKALGDDINDDAFKGFLEEYGDLWGVEPEKIDDEEQQHRDAVDKMNSAQRTARNIKDEPFKMPNQHELARMNPTKLAELMAQAQAASQK